MAFSEIEYLWRYPDVAAAVQAGAFQSAEAHYNAFGKVEGRNGNAATWFDETYYRNAYPDVAAAIQSGAIASGRQHFFSFGISEGRDPSTSFANDMYLKSNPDVAEAVSSGALSSGYRHYDVWGQYENRSGQGRPLAYGTDGDDTLSGAGRLVGGAGNDTLTLSGANHGSASGGPGDDTIVSGDARWSFGNTLFGDDGNDTLVNGAVMYGGSGPGTDIFAFTPSGGLIPSAIASTIMDFQDGVDRIKISGYSGITSFADVAGAISVADGDTVIALTYNRITIKGTPALTGEDFLFG